MSHFNWHLQIQFLPGRIATVPFPKYAYLDMWIYSNVQVDLFSNSNFVWVGTIWFL